MAILPNRELIKLELNTFRNGTCATLLFDPFRNGTCATAGGTSPLSKRINTSNRSLRFLRLEEVCRVFGD